MMMKTLSLFIAGSLSVLTAMAAPESYVALSASNATSAAVYFEPGVRPARLVVADVTSDKAASLLSWRVGAQQVTLLSPAAADVTNMLVTVGTIASNAALVSVTAAGTVTAHTAFTNVLLTNILLTFHNPIGTNLAIGDTLRERTTTFYDVSAFSSTNLVTVISNVSVTAGVVLLAQGTPGQLQTNTVTSWTTNEGNYVVNFTNAFAFTPTRLYTLASQAYAVKLAASRTSAEVVVDVTTGLASADQLVLLPASGGVFMQQLSATNAYRYQYQNLKAVTGLALAAGDRLFVLDTAVTTPVGAATLRLFGDPVRLLPANVPGVLSLDGTSAVTINQAIVDYD